MFRLCAASFTGDSSLLPEPAGLATAKNAELELDADSHL